MIITFAEFTINTELFRIYLQDQCICEDEKKVILLILLFEHSPNSVSKQRLIETLWPNTIVNETSLTKLVSQVRKLFTRYNQPNPIITVHRQGYKLNALSLPADLPEATAINTPVTKYRKFKLLIFFIFVLCVTGFFIIGHQPSSTKASHNILWVDDHPENNQWEIDVLNNNGIKVYTSTNTKQAMQMLRMYQYDLVISDMGRQQDYTAGLALLQQMRQQNNNTVFILYSNPVSEQKRELVQEFGGQFAIEKRSNLFKAINEVLALNLNLSH